MAEEQIVTNIVAKSDFSNLITDLNKVSSALTGLQDKLQATNKTLAAQVAVMNRSFAETMRSTGQFSTHFVSLSSDVEKFGSQLDKGQMKLGKFFQTYSQHVKTNGGLIRDLAKQQVQLQNSILQPLGRNAEGLMQYNVHIPRGLDVVKNKTAIAKQELMIMNKVIQEGAGQLINWGKNTQWAGRQLTVGLTVPLAAFGKAASDAFKMADQELVRLTKVYGGIAATSTQELGKVRADVVKTATEISKAYGRSFSDTIALAADIAATGKQGNELLGSVRETSRLAVLGEVDRQDAMKATLAIQTAFKQNTEELSESINFLNAVENQTSTTLNDLVEAIPKAGPIVKGLGGDVKDLALYLTAMREGGISASEGANALKSGLASLINPTKVAKGMFEGFGISLTDIVQRNAGDTTATILELQSALETLNPLQKQQALEQLFGKFQFARMNALFENLGKQGSQTLQVLDLMKASSQDLAGIAGRELSMVTESASGKYKRAIEGLRADLAGIGEQFLKINTTLITFVDGILKFVQALPNPIKQALGFLGMITAVAGPLIMLTGVLGNFFGYIIKGASHFRAFFKGGEGWKLLTPEILAAQKAGNLVEQTFYSDAKAAAVLKQAIASLAAEFGTLEQRAMSAAVSVNPAVSTVGGTTIMAGNVNPSHPLVGKPGTRAAAHHNPRSGMSQAQRDSQTIHSVTPAPIPVNQKIGAVPQIFMGDNFPQYEGLTTSKGVSTGIVAGEAAKWHAMMGSLSMMTKQEVAALKKEIARTGTFSAEINSTFSQLLPAMTKLTGNAATQSAAIVRQLQAGKLTVDAARAKIIAINAELEMLMAQTTSKVATDLGRTANLTQVPLINQPIVSNTGKSNIKEIFRPNRKASGMLDKIAKVLGVRTWGGGYSTETTMPKKFAGGVTALGLRLPRFTNRIQAKGASKLLRSFSEQAGRIGGSRVPSAGQAATYLAAQRGERVTSRSRGMSTAAHVEQGAGKTYREFSKRQGDLYKDPEMIKYGITPTKPGIDDENQVLVHGIGKAFRNRTRNLTTLPGQSAPIIPGDQLSSLNMTGKTNKPYVQLLPTQFVKNREGFNKNLNKGIATSADWAPVTGDDMVSLKYFLKEQGVNVQAANRIAARAADVLNDKIANSKGPITEQIFGDMLNQASIRGIRSAFLPMMSQSSASAARSSDPFWGRGNLLPTPFKNGVSQLPGYGGGDIVPALLEPGESVVTKTATSGNQNAITLMNQGYPIDRMLGFKNGVTNLKMPVRKYAMGGLVGQMVGGTAGWMGGQALGSMAGGDMGGMIGGMAGSMMIPAMLSRTSKVADDTVPKLGRFKSALNAIVMLPGPVKLLGGLMAIGAAVKTVNDKINEHRQIINLAFGPSEDAAQRLGIKYNSLTNQLKDFAEQTKLSKANIEEYYAATQASGVPGLNLTIKQLKELKTTIEKDFPDYVSMFNKADPGEVIVKAQQLKAQLVAGGMGAEEATKKIYAMISVSDKANQAVQAIANSGFAAIKDKATAAVQSVKTFNALLKEGNTDQLSLSFDTVITSLQSAEKSLVGTKDAQGKLITEAEAFNLTLESISNKQMGNNKLNQQGVDALSKQNEVMGLIVNKSDTIQGAFAKMKLYLSGIDVDIKSMSSEMATLAAKAVGLATQNLVGGKYKAITDEITRLTTIGSSDKAVKAQQKIQVNLDDQIKKHQKIIDQIKEEADARVKGLERQNSTEDYNLQIKKLQIEYQERLASGDMSGAAQAQIDIQSLSSSRQKDLAVNAIRDKEAADVKAQEAIIEGLQKKIDGSQATIKKATDSADASLKKAAELQVTLNELVTATLNAANGTLDRKQIANLQTKLKGFGFADLASSIGGQGPRIPYADDLRTKTTGIEGIGKSALSEVINGNKELKTSDSALLAYFTNPKSKFGQTAVSPTTLTLNAGSKYQSTGQFVQSAELAKAGVKPGKNGYVGQTFVGADGATYEIMADAGRYGLSVKKKMAVGGFVSGAGSGKSDSIPAMLSNGEYVINADSVKKYGVQTFNAFNNKKYSMGGPVTRMPYSAGGLASSANSLYNINVTLNGSDLDANDVARAIHREMKMREIASGRSRNI
jgi:TP901 family phage tail tape measure protein